MSTSVNPKRIQTIQSGSAADATGPVLYWMHRDQRLHQNWAVLFAQERALHHKAPFHIVFCIDEEFPVATERRYEFLLTGLAEVESECRILNIPFSVLIGKPAEVLADYVKQHSVRELVVDFEPLHNHTANVKSVVSQISITTFQVDAHNIVPCWEASPRLEFAAYTIRKKINSQLEEFLTEFPMVVAMPLISDGTVTAGIDWNGIRNELRWDQNVTRISWCSPGARSAQNSLNDFSARIKDYALRNDPMANGQSNLSPFLHFGQISAQHAASVILSTKTMSNAEAVNDFLEELVVRRELSDNFTFYNVNYENFLGLPAWAQKTLNDHRTDKRGYVYELDVWEVADTHDKLWNAAQREMMVHGKMHGYLRMYWAKKILEWSTSPEVALSTANYLNDKYSLDGCDPNGYVGVAWSVGGVHDRAWQERSVYGKIRYMNANGCVRKFDVKSYIEAHEYSD